MTLQDIRKALEADVLTACEAMLGTHLVRGPRRARIVEVEAYRAADDPGSHAHRGPTPRNEVMFGLAGFAYVYFTYGTHWMLNITAHTEGDAAGILIRAAQPLEGVDLMRQRRPKARALQDLLSGPAKITAAFDITRADNGKDLLNPKTDLRFEPGEPVRKVLSGLRIGLAEGKGDRLPWRFVDADSLEWISRPLVSP